MLRLRTVQASTYIKVPRNLAFAVLTGYESYRDWMPDVLESRLLAAEGDVAITEFVAPAYGPGKFVLEFVGSSDDWLMFNQVDRYRRDGLSGRWDFEGTDAGSGVVVRASLSLKNGLFRIGTRRGLRQVLERTLDALASRSLRLAAHGALGAGLGKRKILELVRGGDSLRIHFDGATYRLVRESERGAT
ncbi:MAG: hypothetical protein GY769_12420 [bacterium]|nr:hypothetical protein [bacterium]